MPHVRSHSFDETYLRNKQAEAAKLANAFAEMANFQAKITAELAQHKSEVDAKLAKKPKKPDSLLKQISDGNRDVNQFLVYLATAVEGLKELKIFQMISDVVQQTLNVCVDIYEQFKDYRWDEKIRALTYISAMISGVIILIAGLISPAAIVPFSPVGGAALATIGAFCARKLTNGFKDAKEANELDKRLNYLEWAYQHLVFLASIPQKAVTFGYAKARECYQSFSSRKVEDEHADDLEKGLLAGASAPQVSRP